MAIEITFMDVGIRYGIIGITLKPKMFCNGFVCCGMFWNCEIQMRVECLNERYILVCYK